MVMFSTCIILALQFLELIDILSVGSFFYTIYPLSSGW